MKKAFSILLIFSFLSFQKKGRSDLSEIHLYEKANFPIGVAVNFEKLYKDENYRKLINAQFNSITPEKCMKPEIIHPEKDVFNFSETDMLMDYCLKNNKMLHGHTLVWHKELPEWMENFKGDRSAWELMLKEHIQTIIIHCKDHVKSWDVINEAFNSDGSLRENIWLKNIGESYIEKSFVYAREADPSAKLFYNDFDLESSSKKLTAVLKFLNNIKGKGIKIDGIGVQMHISVSYPYVSQINEAAMRIEEEGYLIHYSEFDISLKKSDKLFTMTNHLLKLQKERMKEIVQGYLKLKIESRFGITMWGASDNDTWLSKNNKMDKPLLFDYKYKPKPIYFGFLEALSEQHGK